MDRVHSEMSPCTIPTMVTKILKTLNAMPDIRTGPAEIKLDRKKFGKEIVLKFMRQICLNCVNDLKMNSL